MSWEVRATEEELYAQFARRGPVLVIAPDGTVTEQFRDIDIIEPMVTLDDAVGTVLGMIQDVPLSKAVREKLAKALGVIPAVVGTEPVRKTKESTS
jgi:hypothetical protein